MPRHLLLGLGLASVLSLSSVCAALPLRIRDLPEVSDLLITTRSNPNAAQPTFTVRGTLQSSTGKPLAGFRMSLEGVESQPCAADRPETAADGAFCLETRAASGTKCTLVSAAQEYYSAVRKALALIPSVPHLELVIPAGTQSLDLSQPLPPLFVELRAPREHVDNYTLELAVTRSSDGEQRTLWSGASQISALRPAKFEVPPAALGTPGPAELVASINLGPKQRIQTRAKLNVYGDVTLNWSEKPTTITPETGFELHVRAESNGQPVTSGGLKVEVNDQTLADVPIHGPLTPLQLAFSAPRQKQVAVRVSYLSTSPYLRPGVPLEDELSIQPSSPLRQLPWLLLALSASYWVMRAWRRPIRSAQPDKKTPSAPATAGIQRHTTKAEDNGWYGRVIDAHTRDPVAFATLRIERPGMDGVHELAHCTTDPHGNFKLAPVHNLPEGVRWVTESAQHSTLVTAVPTMGSMEVSLVSRRRTLLLSLFKWVKAAGLRFGGSKPPTPQEVAARANAQANAPVAQWAIEIEQAAYGPEAPSAAQERSLLEATPPLDRPIPDKR